MKGQLNYVVVNGGDGSASVRFCKTQKIAQIYDDFRQFHEGWGEGESFTKDVEFDEDGNLLDQYCVNAERELENAIAGAEDDPEYKEACEKWLSEIREELETVNSEKL